MSQPSSSEGGFYSEAFGSWSRVTGRAGLAALTSKETSPCRNSIIDMVIPQKPLKLPYPYFGGKTKAAPLIWQAIGDTPNYIEPFFGGGAALILRPDYNPLRHLETVNDLDSNLANFWRCLQKDPEQLSYWADSPVNEVDLHARHRWLRGRTWGQDSSFSEQMRSDPSYCDYQQAGWWVWGVCASIGTFLESPKEKFRELPHLGNGGQGIHRKMPHLGDGGQGIHRKMPHLGGSGRGIHRKMPHLGGSGQGDLLAYFEALAARFRRVRVCCGDFERVLSPTITTRQGITGVLLDPPYLSHEKLYAESGSVAHRAREWAIANGDNPKLRIVLCGYEGEHTMPAGWRKIAWKANQGYATDRNTKRDQERLYLSPFCLHSPLESP